MARLHFVKNGKDHGGGRLTRSIDISMESAISYLGNFETKHSESPPTINPNVVASHYAKYEHVVLEIDQNETSGAFTKPGFYVIIGLHACDAISKLDASGTTT